MRLLLPIFIVLCIAFAHAETITEGVFTVHFAEDDRATAQQTLSEALAFSDAMGERLPIGDEPVTIVIASTVAEFIQHAGPFGRPDIAGIAIPSRGFILLKSPRIIAAPDDYNGVLRHEIVHVLLYRNVNVDALPGWLNEGLCMHLSKEHRWLATWRVAEMYARGTILNYREIDLAFTADRGEKPFGDIYAQSLSMTRYLLNEMDDDAFWAMIADLDTMDFRAAIVEHTGWTTADFWRAWRGSLWSGAMVTSLVSGITIFQLAALLLLFGWWRKRGRTQAMLADMEEDENEPLMPWEVPLEQGPYDWEEDDEDDY